MSRVMIIGSSHVGAYKNAEKPFAESHPDIELSFFAVRGPLFLRGTMDEAGIFTPPFRDEKDRALVAQTNGSDVADASGFDHLLLVGHRFAFNAVIALLSEHDILEGARTGNPRLISETMLKEIIVSVTRVSVLEACDAFAPFGKQATFVMAPYPAISILERRDSYELARALDQFWQHPDATWLEKIWLDEVRIVLEQHGHRLLVQPAALSAGPYATAAEYAKRAARFESDVALKTDHRHMNADFGLAMLCEYAEKHLDRSRQSSTPNTKVKRRA